MPIETREEHYAAKQALEEQEKRLPLHRAALKKEGLTPDEVERSMEPLLCFAAQKRSEVEAFEQYMRSDEFRAKEESHFNGKMHEILSAVPEEFRDALGHRAWEEGHSSGFDEVLNCLSGLVDELSEPIRRFEERVRGRSE